MFTFSGPCPTLPCEESSNFTLLWPPLHAPVRGVSKISSPPAPAPRSRARSPLIFNSSALRSTLPCEESLNFNFFAFRAALPRTTPTNVVSSTVEAPCNEVTLCNRAGELGLGYVPCIGKIDCLPRSGRRIYCCSVSALQVYIRVVPRF